MTVQAQSQESAPLCRLGPKQNSFTSKMVSISPPSRNSRPQWRLSPEDKGSAEHASADAGIAVPVSYTDTALGHPSPASPWRC